jgi:hypothetical protein
MGSRNKVPMGFMARALSKRANNMLSNKLSRKWPKALIVRTHSPPEIHAQSGSTVSMAVGVPTTVMAVLTMPARRWEQVPVAPAARGVSWWKSINPGENPPPPRPEGCGHTKF